MHTYVEQSNRGHTVQYGSYHGNTGEAPNLNTKLKTMADSWFALSNQNIVEQLKENVKTKNMLKTRDVLIVLKLNLTNFLVKH